MTTKNVHQRILGVMQDVNYIQKSEKKVANQYRFVSHDQVSAILHPAFVQHGIVVIPTVMTLTQDGNRTSVCLRTDFVNADNPLDKIEVLSWGYGIDPSDKGPGKAVSYAYKYALLKTFCLETGDDPDQDQNTAYEPPAPAKPSVVSQQRIDKLTALLKRCDAKYVVELETNVAKAGIEPDWTNLNVEAYDKIVTAIESRLKKAA